MIAQLAGEFQVVPSCSVMSILFPSVVPEIDLGMAYDHQQANGQIMTT